MKGFASANRLAWTLTLALAMLAGVRPALGADDSQRFLEALREREYFDVALEYLEQAGKSPRTDRQFQDRIDYEAGLTLIEASRRNRSMNSREGQLAEAKERFDSFLESRPKHPLALSARRQLANVLVERGRIKLEQAAQPGKSPAEVSALREGARPLLEEARKVFQTLEAAAETSFKRFPKTIPESDTATIEARKQAYEDVLDTRLAAASILYELAQTYPAESKGRKELLAESAKEFATYYEKHGRFLAGMYGRLWEARSRRDLGEVQKAKDIFDDLLTLPDEPAAYRALKNKTLVIAMETAMLPSEKDYAGVLEMGAKWESTMRGDEEVSPDGLAIRCFAGEAALEVARTLKKNESARRRELLQFASGSLEFVKRFPGEYQQRAIVALQSKEFQAGAAEKPEVQPKDFAEARDAGQRALERMSALETAIKLDEGKGAQDSAKEEQLEAARNDALRYFRMALEMAPPDAPLDELNSIRYYLTYLHWSAGHYYEAAVLGEFLARRYPNSAGGRPGAKIAMAAYAMLYNEAPKGQRQFETDRMVAMAGYVAARWADQPESVQAWMVLINTAVQDHDLRKAGEYLDKIPPNAPRRGEAELMVGQAMWSEYLRGMRKPEEERPPQAELDQLVADAKSTLEKGVDRMRKEVENGMPVSYTVAAAVLSLSQIYIQTVQAEEAVGLLEDKRIGPLTLVGEKRAVVNRPGFNVEAMKAALRAYVATQQTDKALQVMEKLENAVRQEGDADASAKLTRIYIGLGRELEEQLELLRSERRPAEINKVSEGFEVFLSKILERDTGNNFNSLNWVAETFAGLAAGTDTGGTTLDPKAEGYYNKALETYNKILSRLAEPEFGAPEGASPSIKLRMARCYRRLGDYKTALSWLLDVLKEKPTMVDAQIEAAYTFQDWGAEQPEWYSRAISGSTVYRDLWGWGQLARRVQSHPSYRDLFHEARYNLAVCRMKLAQARSGEAQAALLKQAEADITIVYRLYPDLGGEEWFDKYDSLLKTIQKLRGVPATGLKGVTQ